MEFINRIELAGDVLQQGLLGKPTLLHGPGDLDADGRAVRGMEIRPVLVHKRSHLATEEGHEGKLSVLLEEKCSIVIFLPEGSRGVYCSLEVDTKTYAILIIFKMVFQIELPSLSYKTNMAMNYGYIRVSTDTQTTRNQEFEITRFCKAQGLSIDGWIEETISGQQAYNKRALGDLLRRVGDGDLIICTELSRLGRSLFMIMEILNICMNKGCQVWSVKEGYRLGDDIQSKVLAFAFGLSAEIERRLISERTREALARKKAEGKHLGRIPGSHNRGYKLDNQSDHIKKLMKKHMSLSQIANCCGVSISTLYRWLERRNLLK